MLSARGTRFQEYPFFRGECGRLGIGLKQPGRSDRGGAEESHPCRATLALFRVEFKNTPNGSKEANSPADRV